MKKVIAATAATVVFFLIGIIMNSIVVGAIYDTNIISLPLCSSNDGGYAVVVISAVAGFAALATFNFISSSWKKNP